MKKVLIILISVVLLTGCGMTDEEKNTLFYESLEKAYSVLSISKGMGLPVYEESKVTIKDVDWYKTSNSEYTSYEKIEDTINSVFDKESKKSLTNKLSNRYREIDAELYSTGTSGCALDYVIGETLLENLKKDVKIVKVKSSKIVFKYKDKEYTAKLDNDNYIFSEDMFECK